MWVLFAFGSALFAGITAVLAKLGIEKTDSYLVTALRTVIVVIFAWLMVFVAGSFHTIGEIGRKTFVFLILSGMATGASWICSSLSSICKSYGDTWQNWDNWCRIQSGNSNPHYGCINHGMDHSFRTAQTKRNKRHR